MRKTRLWMLFATLLLPCNHGGAQSFALAATSPSSKRCGFPGQACKQSSAEAVIDQFKNVIKSMQQCDTKATLTSKIDSVHKSLERLESIQTKEVQKVDTTVKDVQKVVEAVHGGVQDTKYRVQEVHTSVQTMHITVKNTEYKQKEMSETIATHTEKLKLLQNTANTTERKLGLASSVLSSSLKKINDINDNVNDIKRTQASTEVNVDSISAKVDSMDAKLDKVLAILTNTTLPPPEYTTQADSKTPSKDCQALYESGSTSAGVYTIQPGPDTVTTAYCELGYTTLQRRADGQEDFQRLWQDFVQGFGSRQQDYWLGLKPMNLLTRGRRCKLRLLLNLDDEALSNKENYKKFPLDGNGQVKYIEAAKFQVGDPDSYKLLAEDISTDLQLKLYALRLQSTHNGMPFTTRDKDQDPDTRRNCAERFRGGWWYNSCFYVNLNGSHRCGASNHVAAYVTPYCIRRTEIRMRC